MTSSRLYDEQTETGLGKITKASVFRLKRQHIYIYAHTYIFYGSLQFSFCSERMEVAIFQQTSISLLKTATENLS
jgi:hypothetical protein